MDRNRLNHDEFKRGLNLQRLRRFWTLWIASFQRIWQRMMFWGLMLLTLVTVLSRPAVSADSSVPTDAGFFFPSVSTRVGDIVAVENEDSLLLQGAAPV